MPRLGVVGTLTEGELEYQLENDKVDLKYVQIPFSSIPDSVLTVKKSDITNYIKKFPKKYEVEASRNLVYVQFKETASLEDEQTIQADLTALIEDKVEFNEAAKANETVVGFKNTSDSKAFVNANSSSKFNDEYVFESKLPNAQALIGLSLNEVYGPYKDGTSYKLSKLVSVFINAI